MAETFDIDQESFQLSVTLAPASRRRRLPGWATSLAAAAAVLLVSVPTVLWINHSQDSAAAPEITIDGTGTVIFESEDAQPQTMTFTVQVSTNGPATGFNIPSAGPVEITIQAARETWQIKGDAVCIRDLSEETTGMWEVRFSTTVSTRPELIAGQYGSLYLKDDPIGDKAGELLGTPDRHNPSCGPRGAQLAPLDTGAISITH
jgi:hypothetical protein